MTNTVADALPREIARVTEKKERWIKMATDHPEIAPGMNLTINIMKAEIDQAVSAIAQGDTVQMIRSLESLRGYSDDD